jgi:hypothetical protein
LFPVELRTTGASVTFTAGRLIGSAMPYLDFGLPLSARSARHSGTFCILA